MAKQENIQNFGAFTHCDYKKPVGRQNDMRTSTYMGQKKFLDDGSHPTIDILKNTAEILGRKEIQYDYISESTEEFKSKFSKETNNATLPMRLERVQYIKPLLNRNIGIAPRPIKTYKTIYQQDFEEKHVPRESYIKTNYLYTPKVEKSNNYINAAKSGFAKHLDLMTTTNRLTYVQHTNEDRNGISSNDNITFWNPIKQIGNLSRVPTECCPNPSYTDKTCLDSIPRKAQTVPNRGKISETREEYQVPNKTIRDLEGFVFEKQI